MERNAAYRLVRLASLALFVALGGTSYAIASNSVGTKQLKKNAVISSKVRNGTLRARDIHKASLGADRLTAAARASLKGQTGPKGATGATGPAGPSNAYASATEAGANISTLPGTVAREITVPAGDYVVSATAAVDNQDADVDRLGAGQAHDAALADVAHLSPRLEIVWLRSGGS